MASRGNSASGRCGRRQIRVLNETRPAVLILSPPCTMFSAMQNINIYKMKRSSTDARIQVAVAHFAFAVLLCIKHAQRARIFVLEHPVGASSWSTQLASLVNQ